MNKLLYKKICILIFCSILVLSGSVKMAPQVNKKSSFQNNLPYSQNIVSNMLENSRKIHPRLLADKNDFMFLKKNIHKDKYLKKWYEQLTFDTKSILQSKPVNFELNNGKLSIGQTVTNKIISLSLMYVITEKEIYAERAWLEMKTLSDDKVFPNWNPSNFLDTAEIMTAVSIGYDWLYDYLNQEQKNYIRKAIINKGLSPALNVYSGTANKSQVTTFWNNTTNNWNTVCNAAIIIGALVVGDESKSVGELSGEIIQYAVESIRKSLMTYAPNGGMPEGKVYWYYATLYLAYLFSSMDISLDTTYGLEDMQGISETGYYPIYITGPTKKVFNFGDATSSDFESLPQLFYYSNKYKNDDFSSYALDYYHPLNLIWYKNNFVNNLSDLPQDKFYKDISNGLALMRNDWNDNAMFVAVRAGYNQTNHGDLDIGNFVIDVNGERWAEDLGSESYSSQGYFNMSSDRWNYYKKGTEGQNTLTINPEINRNQNINATSLITKSYSSKSKSYSIIDLTNAYYKDAYSIQRGVALIKDKLQVIIQDEFNLKLRTTVVWSMHTYANIKISDNKKEAILTLNYKNLYIYLINSDQGQFNQLKLKSTSGNNNLNYMNKLMVKLDGVQNGNITVVFSPNLISEKDLKIYKVTDLIQ